MMSEEPNTAAAFMANLLSSSSQVNEKEHLGFDDEYDFLTNTIPYKKLSLVSDAENVSTEASAATSDQIAMIAILNNLTSQVVGHAKTNQEITLENETLKNELVRCKQEIENELLKSTLSAKDKSIEFLKYEKEKKPRRATVGLHQDILGTRNLGLGYLAKRTQPVLYDGNTLLDPTHTPVSVWDSDDVLVHQLQRKDKTIRNLQAQHDIVSLLNVGPIDGRKALETKLTQLKDTITALRIQNDEFKVTNATQKTKIAKLKAKDVGNKSSGTITPTNPKVLALGMYTIGPKNPKPSPRVTKKPVAPQVKKANVTIHLSTGIKFATRASKTAFKNHAWIYRKLLAKSTSGEKVDDHPRNMNKQNHVDSHLNAKRLVSISNLNAVCGACHECFFSFNHDKCVVYSMNSVKPKATPNRQTTKKV
nr:hypothetical protein [Tanacetum cinerariifolium]